MRLLIVIELPDKDRSAAEIDEVRAEVAEQRIYADKVGGAIHLIERPASVLRVLRAVRGTG